MATEGLRRSGRARKQIKTYAEEQAEQTQQEKAAAPKKASRKKRTKAQVEEDDEDSEEEEDEFVEEPPKKRTKKAATSKTKIGAGQEWISEAAEDRIAHQQSRVKKLAPGKEEKRLKRYVDEDDLREYYTKFLKRANSEKMFILERTRDVEENCHANHDDCPCETLQLAGSTGNIYRIRISHLTSCTCPVNVFTTKGHEKQCEHVLYVLHHILKAPDHLRYQQAFLTSELKELFANTPPLPAQVVEEQEDDGKRKTLDDAECPISYMDLKKKDEVVWCKAACGNNLHKGCFDQWAKVKANVTCPLCRTPWQDDKKSAQQTHTVAEVEETGTYGVGGYRNVREQLDYD